MDQSLLPARFDAAIAAWAAAPEFRRKHVLDSLNCWERTAESKSLNIGLAYTSVLLRLAANPHANVPGTLVVALRDCNLNDRVRYTLDGKRSVVRVVQAIVVMLLLTRDGDRKPCSADQLGPTAFLAIPRDDRSATLLAAQVVTVLAMAALVVSGLAQEQDNQVTQ